MSDTILHAVIHSRTASNADNLFIDPSQQGQFEEAHKASMGVLHDYLDKGYQIIDSFDAKSGTWNVRQYLLHLPEDNSQKIEGLMTVSLRDLSVESTFSKSAKQSFDYLKCEFSDNKYVNIFDHPDSERNTWKICLNRGWTWEGIQTAIYKGYPISATLSYDGQWYTLVDIEPEIAHYETRLHIDTMFKGNSDE